MIVSLVGVMDSPTAGGTADHVPHRIAVVGQPNIVADELTFLIISTVFGDVYLPESRLLQVGAIKNQTDMQAHPYPTSTNPAYCLEVRKWRTNTHARPPVLGKSDCNIDNIN